jgi:ankyrin repeat protein
MQDDEGVSAIHIACQNGDVDVATVLIENGATVNARANVSREVDSFH